MLIVSIFGIQSLAGNIGTFSENFEGYDVGDHPTTLVQAYNGTGTGNQIIVQDSNANKAFQMQGASNWAASHQYYYVDDLLRYTVVEVDVKAISGRWPIRLGLFNKDNGYKFISSVTFYNGKIGVYNQGGSINTRNDYSDYVVDQWYNIKLIHDELTHTYDVYVDDEAMVLGVQSRSDVVPNKLEFTAGNHGKNTVYIDNINTYTTGIKPSIIDDSPEPSNNNPSAEDDTAATIEGDKVTIDVLDNDGDIDGDTLTIMSIDNLDSLEGYATIEDEKIDFTPADGFYGQATFDYSISDGKGGTASATVKVDVTKKNRGPQLQNDYAETFEQKRVVIDVLANDSDPDGDEITVTGVYHVSGGLGSMVVEDNKVVFTPDEGVTGKVKLQYGVLDEAGHDSFAYIGIFVKEDRSEEVFEIGCFNIAENDVTVNWSPVENADTYKIWYNGVLVETKAADGDSRFEAITIEDVPFSRVNYVQVVAFDGENQCGISQNMKIVPVTVIAGSYDLVLDYFVEHDIAASTSVTVLVEDGDELKITVEEGFTNDFYYNDTLDGTALSIYVPYILMDPGYENDYPVIIRTDVDVIEEPEEPGEEPEPEQPVVSPPAPTVYYDLVVTSTEGGKVQGFEGSNSFASGTRVNLSVEAEEGFTFVGYEGDTVEDNVLLMTSDKEVNAVFEAIVVEAPQEIEEEIEDETVPEDSGQVAEEEILDVPVPEADPLPTTGGLPMIVFALLGGSFVGLGIESKRKK